MRGMRALLHHVGGGRGGWPRRRPARRSGAHRRRVIGGVRIFRRSSLQSMRRAARARGIARRRALCRLLRLQLLVPICPPVRCGAPLSAASESGRLPQPGPRGVGRASGPSLPELRRAASVHDKPRRAGDGDLRLVREPLHSPPAARRGWTRPTESTRRVRTPTPGGRWLGTRRRPRRSPAALPFPGSSVPSTREPGVGRRG